MLKFTKREWIMIVSGLMVLVVLVAGQVVFRGPWRTYKRSAVDLAQAQQDFLIAQEMQTVIEEERTKQEKLSGVLQARGAHFDLWTYIQQILDEGGIQKRAQLKSRSVVSSENLAEVNLALTGVSMDELLTFLHRAYASNNLIYVYRLDWIKASSDGEGLDFSATFVAPKN